MKPGRVCPTDYRTNPRDLSGEPHLIAETLYIVGGLYGNAFALDAIEAMAGAEPGPVTIVFNGDAHWFDADIETFRRLDVRLAQYPAICGNIELELRRNLDIGAGCGCAYPETVDEGVVVRSNAILKTLAACIRNEKAIKGRFRALPKMLLAHVGPARIAIVHGDAWSVAGWRFSREALDAAEANGSMNDLRCESRTDAFASTHTCEAVMRRFHTASGEILIANNGAAGMANFVGDTRGLITRISRRRSPFSALYGAQVRDVYVEAVPVAFDHSTFVDQFDHIWPEGSPAAVSYRERIVGGGCARIETAKPSESHSKL